MIQSNLFHVFKDISWDGPQGLHQMPKNPWHRKDWDSCSRELRCWGISSRADTPATGRGRVKRGCSVGTMNQLNKSTQSEAKRQGEQEFLPLQGLGIHRNWISRRHSHVPIQKNYSTGASLTSFIPYNQPSPNKNNVLHWPLNTYQVPGQYKTHHRIRFYGHRM